MWGGFGGFGQGWRGQNRGGYGRGGGGRGGMYQNRGGMRPQMTPFFEKGPNFCTKFHPLDNFFK